MLCLLGKTDAAGLLIAIYEASHLFLWGRNDHVSLREAYCGLF